MPLFRVFEEVEMKVILDDEETYVAGEVTRCYDDDTFDVMTLRQFYDGDREHRVPADDLRRPHEDMDSRTTIYRDPLTKLSSIRFWENAIEMDHYTAKYYINVRDDMQGGALRWFPLDRVRTDNAAALADSIKDFADETEEEYDADPDYQP